MAKNPGVEQFDGMIVGKTALSDKNGEEYNLTNPFPVQVTLPSAAALGNGRQTVTTPGTPVALAGSTSCKWVTITGETDNTNIVVVGGSGVVAALATRTGKPLWPGQSFTIPIDNLADVFIDAITATEGVTYVYGT